MMFRSTIPSGVARAATFARKSSFSRASVSGGKSSSGRDKGWLMIPAQAASISVNGIIRWVMISVCMCATSNPASIKDCLQASRVRRRAYRNERPWLRASDASVLPAAVEFSAGASKPTDPPGFRKRCHLRRTSGISTINTNAAEQRMRSNPSRGKSAVHASPSRSSIFWKPRSSILRRACASIPGEISKPMTRPDAPAWRAASIATNPVPVATSRTV